MVQRQPLHHLGEYLADAYSTAELLRLPDRLDVPLAGELPVIDATHLDVAHAFAGALGRRRLINAELFSRLRVDRPQRVGALAELEAMLGSTSAEPAAAEGVSSACTHRLFIRSQAFNFSREFSFSPDEPASALMERVLQEMRLPTREVVRVVVVVTFTYALHAFGGALDPEEPLDAQGVKPGSRLKLTCTPELIPIAEYERDARRRHGITLRGDDEP